MYIEGQPTDHPHIPTASFLFKFSSDYWKYLLFHISAHQKFLSKDHLNNEVWWIILGYLQFAWPNGTCKQVQMAKWFLKRRSLYFGHSESINLQDRHIGYKIRMQWLRNLSKSHPVIFSCKSCTSNHSIVAGEIHMWKAYRRQSSELMAKAHIVGLGRANKQNNACENLFELITKRSNY